MNNEIIRPDKLERAVLKVYDAMQKKNSKKWMECDEISLWYELVACILGSKIPFEQSQAAARFLLLNDLLKIEDCLSNCVEFENRIFHALSSSISIVLDKDESIFKYRYPRLRAEHIRRTAESIYRKYDSIKSILSSNKDPQIVRMNIIAASVGIGPKQSSLFLRNIGFADDLAILDSHVLRYMCILGMINIQTYGISTLRRYQEIEKQLEHYTKKLGLTLAYLDTAIWVTMRVFQREFVI